MRKFKRLSQNLFVLSLGFLLSLSGCGYSESSTITDGYADLSSVETEQDTEATTEQKQTNTSPAESEQRTEKNEEEIIIDYGDAESFEAALNEGKNLEGKIVQFVVRDYKPDSAFGYNLISGEHLNFISSRNPDAQVNDTVIAKTTTIESLMGSWIIHYEKIDNAVISKDTITASSSEESTETENNESSEDNSDSTYEHNEYYDITETAEFQNSIGDTIIIHKVLAKKNVAITATLLAYGADGSVLGKSSDEITLTEGQANFFRYSFDGDVSNASIQANAKASSDSFMTGERNAVEMVQYNQTGDDLYITFKQNVDELNYFAKFKLLFYKGNQIVDTEDGYFSTYAENLNGKGTTDVAEVWVYDIDYDTIEYIFEP